LNSELYIKIVYKIPNKQEQKQPNIMANVSEIQKIIDAMTEELIVLNNKVAILDEKDLKKHKHSSATKEGMKPYLKFRRLAMEVVNEQLKTADYATKRKLIGSMWQLEKKANKEKKMLLTMKVM
jgi:hypothetical protein